MRVLKHLTLETLERIIADAVMVNLALLTPVTLRFLSPRLRFDEIVFTGLRPGEKLCEELFREGKRVRVTKHQHILIAEGDDFDGAKLREGVLELERLAREMDEEGIKRKLRELVPEYQLADS